MNNKKLLSKIKNKKTFYLKKISWNKLLNLTINLIQFIKKLKKKVFRMKILSKINLNPKSRKYKIIIRL